MRLAFRSMLVLAVVVAASSLFPDSRGAAQQRAGTFPVIVVFNDNTQFDLYRPGFRADDRAAANPDAWGYLDRGVAGLAQAIEARGGFRAEHVFSHTIRGFFTCWTGPQIHYIQNDSSGEYI